MASSANPTRAARIGIDARLLAYRDGGIAEHVRRLVDGLERLVALEEVAGGGFVVLAHRRGAPARAAGDGLATRYLWTPPHHRLEALALPVELAPLRLTVFHATDMVLPAFWRGRSVVTVHDVAFMDDPGLLTGASRRYYGAVATSAERADRVITVSEHTRMRLLAHTRVDPARVRVIHNAVPEQFAAAGELTGDRAALDTLGLGDRSFILFVGTIEPRKNLITLLDAYDRLAAEGPAPSLVLAGGDGWLSTPIYERAKAMGPSADVRFLGFVPPASLPALYRGASVLAHPAVDEGFGMTVVEAMAAGTPVIASRAGSLPEVVGDAAVLVRANDPPAWTEAMRRVLSDSATADELRRRGRARASLFNVETMARSTLAVYREVLS